jgi:hypothetical protein
MPTLEEELAAIMAAAAVEAAAPATCRRCGIAYPDHGESGGPVRYVVGGWSSPASAIPLRCPGFAWIDPGPSSSYGGAPEPSFS